MKLSLKTYPSDMPWAIVQAKQQQFAIATQDLREMVMMPEVAEVPNTADYIRGVINLRGRVMPLIDLRKRIGLRSSADETNAFCTLMEQREQDHKKWLGELEASVRERRPFGLTTDPHKCAFGKWYDAYHADSAWVAALLKKFDEPHKQIHAVAIEVQKLTALQDYDKAAQLVTQAHEGILAKLLELFHDLRKLVRDSERETAVILESGGKMFAISVDLAVSIEKFPKGNVEELPPGVPVSHNGVVLRLGKRPKTNEIVLIIETDQLLAKDELMAVERAHAETRLHQPVS